MATIKFNNVGISAISACVPKTISDNKRLTDILPEDEVQKTIENIGIKEKRFVDKDVCSSDLCFKAAEQLLMENNIDRNSIDALIFLSQTPDYKIPATAPVLQHRLGLPKTTLSFDINLACSGYVYALSTAFAYASLQGVNRVLLLVGETFSKITSPKDKVNAPLYGDAGTATLIEKGDFPDSHFLLCSDGSGKDAVIIPAGACRNPVTIENLKEVEMENGNIRSENQIFMDGMDVFNFALSVVPKSIKEIVNMVQVTLDDVDYVVFHQANKFMTDFFAKKLKYPLDKVPYCIDRYGNTSSSSIPLTIVSELEGIDLKGKKVILCGFGAGLSWATAFIEFAQCNVSPIIEY